MKMRFKIFLSGFMAVATLASVIVQPVTVSASELEPEPTSFEQQYPELQDVQDTLDKDEIVEAKDIEIPYGEEFEVEVDLSGIEGVNEKKVKVLFHEAKSEAGTDFDAHTPDTYKAVYAVEPVSGHPAYRVSRNITVKEPETEAQAKSSSENTAGEGNAGETEDSGNADEDADSDGSKEIVTNLTDGQEVTTDEESGLTVSEVMDQAENEGIDLYEMEPGETVTFMAATGNARSSQQVSVTRGAEYRYADYGYGTYLTYQYTVKFGNVSATAYCVQPSKPGPGTGTYTINKVGDGKALAKVCYIKLNSFDIEEGVPMMDTSGENIFDGGEDSQSSQNIEVIKEGQSKKTIIVGAHYDSAGTHGVDDNGSGVAVALESALRMIDVETPYTIKYVFFGAEETGMHGSKEYVNSLTKKEKDNIVLMINIDSILAGDNLYLYGGRINDKGVVKDVEAVNKAFEIAKKANLPMQLTPKGNVDYPYPTGQKRSDHAPFSDIGIPYIYFEANNWLNGLPVETENHGLIMHSDKDDLSFIENEYGNRAKDTMANYSHLLHLVLQENNWE